jgi:hypothetical protein
MSAPQMRQLLTIINEAEKLDEFDSEHSVNWRNKHQADGMLKQFFKYPKLLPILTAASHGDRRAQTKVKTLGKKQLDQSNAGTGYTPENRDVEEILTYMVYSLSKNFDYLQQHTSDTDKPSWASQPEKINPAQTVQQIATRYKIPQQTVVAKIKQMAAKTGNPIEMILAKFIDKIGLQPQAA